MATLLIGSPTINMLLMCLQLWLKALLSDACKDGFNMYRFMSEYMQIITHISIYMDNKGAMFMASNLVTSKRSKHIDFRCHLVWDFLNKGIISLVYISSEHNIADILTRSMQRLKHMYFTNMLLQDQREQRLPDY